MRRKMTSSIAVALTLLLSVVTFVPAAPGQQLKRTPVGDTAVLTPATGETLRITVAPGFGVADVSVRLGWMQYGAEGCTGTPAVCRHMVVSQGTTAVQMLDANEAISLDVPGNGSGIRVMVFANRDVQVLAQILDSQGNVVVAFKPGADITTVGQ